MKLPLFILLTTAIVLTGIVLYFYFENINLKKRLSLWTWKQEKKILIKRLSGYNRLQPHHLTSLGFIYSDGYYFQPNMKDRDVIYVQFEGSSYRVFHSINKTFIAAENTLEWFELYYLLAHPDNRNFKKQPNHENERRNN